MSSNHQWFLEALEKLESATPEEKEPMSEAEVFDICVRAVAQKLTTDGAELLQVNRGINSVPAIWFKKSNNLSYIVITTARYPQKPKPPVDTRTIQQSLSDQNANGFWIGVSLAHEFEVFDPQDDQGMPLMKGFGVLPAVSNPINLNDLE